jgi:hypothetical protein
VTPQLNLTLTLRTVLLYGTIRQARMYKTATKYPLNLR